MKVNNISSINFGVSVRIISAENNHHPFLYNEILKLTNEYQLPANFKTPEIELPSVPVYILKKLKELKINFSSK